MRKLTNEQLSRALFAHEAGLLSNGVHWDTEGPCCLVEAVEAAWYWDVIDPVSGELPLRKQSALEDASDWFEGEYRRSWTTSELLAQLEKAGLA